MFTLPWAWEGMWRCEAASRRYLFPPPSKYQVFFWLFLPFFSVVFPSFQISLPFGLSGRSAALRTRPEAPICLSGVRNRLSSLRRAPSGFVTQVFIVTDRKKKKKLSNFTSRYTDKSAELSEEHVSQHVYVIRPVCEFAFMSGKKAAKTAFQHFYWNYWIF